MQNFLAKMCNLLPFVQGIPKSYKKSNFQWPKAGLNIELVGKGKIRYSGSMPEDPGSKYKSPALSPKCVRKVKKFRLPETITFSVIPKKRQGGPRGISPLPEPTIKNSQISDENKNKNSFSIGTLLCFGTEMYCLFRYWVSNQCCCTTRAYWTRQGCYLGSRREIFSLSECW